MAKEKLQPYSEEEAQEEASKLKEKITKGDAKDYQEAAEMLAKEALGRFTAKLEYYGGPKAREKFLEGNPYWERLWNKGEKKEWQDKDDKAKVNEEVLHLVELMPREVERAIETLPFEQALIETQKIIDMADAINQERKVVSKETLAYIFFRLKVTPEMIDRFLESPLEGYVSPDTILEGMNKQSASPEIRKKIIEKYKDRISFGDHPIFGEESVFAGLEDRAEREKEAVGKVLTKRISSIHGKKTARVGVHSYEEENADPFDIQRAIEFFEQATKNGVIVPDYEKKIQDISREFGYIDSYFSDTFIGSLRERLSALEALIEKKLGKKPEGVTGKGLEFGVSKSGARQIYLDGEMIGSAANAKFSEKATNGEVVAWVTTEVIDRDTITGTQTRDNVYAWKKGWSEPKRIFEDHAWSSQRYFRVFAPEVMPDGSVEIKRIDGKENKEEIIKV